LRMPGSSSTTRIDQKGQPSTGLSLGREVEAVTCEWVGRGRF
jgi:hypothetical protein